MTNFFSQQEWRSYWMLKALPALQPSHHAPLHNVLLQCFNCAADAYCHQNIIWESHILSHQNTKHKNTGSGDPFSTSINLGSNCFRRVFKSDSKPVHPVAKLANMKSEVESNRDLPRKNEHTTRQFTEQREILINLIIENQFIGTWSWNWVVNWIIEHAAGDSSMAQSKEEHWNTHLLVGFRKACRLAEAGNRQLSWIEQPQLLHNR